MNIKASSSALMVMVGITLPRLPAIRHVLNQRLNLFLLRFVSKLVKSSLTWHDIGHYKEVNNLITSLTHIVN